MMHEPDDHIDDDELFEDEEEEHEEDRDDGHLLDLLALDDHKLSLVCSERGEDGQDVHLHFSGEEDNPDVFLTLHRWLGEYMSVEVDISQLVRTIAHLNRLAGRSDEDFLEDAGISLPEPEGPIELVLNDGSGDGDEGIEQDDEAEEEEEEDPEASRLGLVDGDDAEAE
jgi:hypothetical protein